MQLFEFYAYSYLNFDSIIMSNVCQIYYTITLDTLDNMVYTLDILATNSQRETEGGHHGKSFDGGNES